MSHIPLVTYSLSELVGIARQGSAFFRDFYRGVPEKPAVGDLPVLEQKKFWEAYYRDAREVLTSELLDGVVLNSGGSTGAPKFSFFSDAEWDAAVALSIRAFEGTGMADGDRVANLFAPGFLYSSFLLATECLKEMRPKVLQFPIGYFTPIPDIVRLVRAFRIDVLAGLPSHILNIVDHLDKEGSSEVRFTRLLFAGEPFTLDQRAFLERRFPGVQIRSLGYASVDAGMMALADETCGPGEHRVLDGASILEIVDEETGEVIRETGQPGRIIFTNLTRRLMPMIRYPSGDRGQWVEPEGAAARKFMLLGRAEEAARLTFYNVPVSEIGDVLQPFRERFGIRQFQLRITQRNLHDVLTLRLVGQGTPETLAAGGREIVESLMRAKPSLAHVVSEGIANPIEIEWIEAKDLVVTPRTGKVRMVVDERMAGGK